MPSRVFTTGSTYTAQSEVRAQLPVDVVTIVNTTPVGGTPTEVTAKFAVVDNPQLQARAFDFNTDEKPGMFPGVWQWTKDDFGGMPIVAVTVRSSANIPASVTVHL